MSSDVEHVETLPDLSQGTGCGFVFDDGRKCLSLKIKARNLCERHYAVLRRAGAFDASRNLTATEDEVLDNSVRLGKARQILERSAPYAARRLREAVKVAASKGHSGPAEWLLLHSRAVRPVPQVREGKGFSDSPIQINIAVPLAGMKDK